MQNLSEKAILVNLKITMWSAKKNDKKVSKQIEKHHNAHHAGRYSKNLISEKALKTVQETCREARDYVYENTLPWGDNADRILTSESYFSFVNEFRIYKEKFMDATNKFIKQYPELKEQAKIRLNGMFQEEDYPSLDKIAGKFDFDVVFMPISNTDDFRLNINEEESEKLKADIQSELDSRVIEANKDMWRRIKEKVGHMFEKLSDKDASFKYTLVENIRELIEVLPRLNFTGDINITNILGEMDSLLVDPESLRTNTKLRNKKASEAKAILQKIGEYF